MRAHRRTVASIASISISYARHRRAGCIERRREFGRRQGVVEDRAFQSRIYEATDRLPDRLREMVLLCAIGELEPTAVAAILGVPAGTVRSRLHAGRKPLLRVMS